MIEEQVDAICKLCRFPFQLCLIYDKKFKYAYVIRLGSEDCSNVRNKTSSSLITNLKRARSIDPMQMLNNLSRRNKAQAYESIHVRSSSMQLFATKIPGACLGPMQLPNEPL